MGDPDAHDIIINHNKGGMTMGYYSTVAIWANAKAIEAMPEQVRKDMFEKEGHFSGAAKRYSSGNICWDIGDTKWYGDDVDNIMAWLRSLKAEEGQLYEFMEITEDGDVTHKMNHDKCDKLESVFKINTDGCN
jgi:hypothetical protein